MRLIIEYQVGDGCTFSGTDTVPVEYESAEAFAVDFEKAVRDSRGSNNRGDFIFANREWNDDHHGYQDSGKWTYWGPTILTVDEWFELHNHRGGGR